MLVEVGLVRVPGDLVDGMPNGPMSWCVASPDAQTSALDGKSEVINFVYLKDDGIPDFHWDGSSEALSSWVPK